jgi:ATP adenylyltransferase
MSIHEGCLFCKIPNKRILDENEFSYVIRDGFPVTEFHALVIPKRHVRDYFELSKEELIACDLLLKKQRSKLLLDDETIEGFNVGINCGEAAGQTVFHCHIHLIPRRKGDVENPRGGIRCLISGKGNY